VPTSLLVHHVQPHNYHHDHDEDEDHSNLQLSNCTLSQNGTNSSVVCAPQLISHSEDSQNFTLSEKDLLHLCPILLYELKAQSGGCIEPAILSDIDSTEKLLEEEKDKDIFYGV